VRIRLSFLRDGELVAEAFADIPRDLANAERILLEDIRRLRPDPLLLDERVTCYLEIMSDDEAPRS
jgi:hypothetical protein